MAGVCGMPESRPPGASSMREISRRGIDSGRSGRSRAPWRWRRRLSAADETLRFLKTAFAQFSIRGEASMSASDLVTRPHDASPEAL